MQTYVELILRSIHLTAAILWFGGVVFSTLITLPILQRHLSAKELLELHNRFRFWIRLMINLLLLTGGIVIFIVAWNSGMKLEAQYMIYSAAKLGAFAIMILFWGLYSSSYQRHLEATPPDKKMSIPRRINVLGHLTLFSGLIVFAFVMLLRN